MEGNERVLCRCLCLMRLSGTPQVCACVCVCDRVCVTVSVCLCVSLSLSHTQTHMRLYDLATAPGVAVLPRTSHLRPLMLRTDDTALMTQVSQMVSRELERECIVVFDEAHNIDNVCIEALSINLRKNTLEGAQRNITRLQSAVERAKVTDAERLRTVIRARRWPPPLLIGKEGEGAADLVASFGTGAV